MLGVEPAITNWSRGRSVESGKCGDSRCDDVTPSDGLVFADSGPAGGAVVNGEFVLSRERFTADLSDPDSAPFHTLASQLVVQVS